MPQKLKPSLLFLGTGSSTGIPVIGCKCAVCLSSSKYNRRMRPSAWIKHGKSTYLIDVGPDFRNQALLFHLPKMDALFLTHTHFDHIAGIDELRSYAFDDPSKISCILSKESYEDLKVRYDYLMMPSDKGILNSQLDFKILENESGSSNVAGIDFKYVSFSQKGMNVTGYIFGNLAYICDIKDYSDEILTDLKGIEILIISAARETSSRMHLSLAEAIDFSRKVHAKKTYFTHISHDMDHETISKRLAPDQQLAYDGLEIEFNL